MPSWKWVALFLLWPGAVRAGSLPRFPASWIHGAKDCAANPDPMFQVHRYDADTYILRMSKCASFEAPFLFLLIGKDKALLLDTGAMPNGGTSTVREVVRGILDRRGGRKPLALVVAHTHGHGDHKAGDFLFEGQPDCTVVGTSPEAVRDFFGLLKWPDGEAAFDLGGRVVTVLPLPGHEVAHVAFYDPKSRLLFTGDTLYPGLLTIRDWPAYQASVRRLAAFADRHPVDWILGCHIEMTRRPREMYPLETTYQPEEHVLQLGKAHLTQLLRAVEALPGPPPHDVHDEFILEYVVPE
ncbi:MAG: MBL fold metallo-hydrolase [Thermoanaerobaculia bacterium]